MPKREGSGRKPAKIDIKQVEELAAIQCTLPEIAAVLGFHLTTIKRHIKEQALREAVDRGRARGVASIKRQQFKLLSEGNATMGVWLGKNYAGQRDEVSHTGADGGPIEHRDVSAREILAARIAGIIARRRAKGSNEGPDGSSGAGAGV